MGACVTALERRSEPERLTVVAMTIREFSWLNEVRVRVAYGEYPERPPDVVFLLLLGGPDLEGKPLDDDAVVAELEPLTWAEDGGTRYQVPYDLDVRKAHFSWGADGASASVLLYLANQLTSGVVGALAGAAAMKALGGIRKTLQPTTRADEFLSTRDELAEYGEWCIRAAYDQWLPDDVVLALVEEASADDEWSGLFRDGTGTEYGVTLRPMDGHPYRVRVSRRTPDAAPIV